MSDKTGIEWTDATWNPVTGCTEVSPGCDHCYAKTFAERFRGTEGHYFERGFDVQLRPEKLEQPLKWARPRRIFVNSMSDLFHDSVPDEYIARVWAIMARSPQHTFQVLTKRHARMRSLLGSRSFRDEFELFTPSQLIGPWPLPNVWLGVSTESQQWADIRIPALLATPAVVRFISAEPLLGHIELYGSPSQPGPAIVRTGVQTRPSTPDGPAEYDYDDQFGLDWVIVGGESGHGARPMDPEWVRSLRDECRATGTAFLFKQWGEYAPICRLAVSDGQVTHRCRCRGANPSHPVDIRRVGKKIAGREFDGRTWDEYPEVPDAI